MRSGIFLCPQHKTLYLRPMKYLLALLIVLFNTLSFAQAFHFNDVQTILVKTTDESPAHWYLEIFSDVQSDTTLRWKAHYGPTLPAEWHFNFDDQYQYYPTVLDGDSADFTLLSNPILPQKLIIGAMLNNTPGNGSIYFDVYDPNDLSTLVTIEYRFVVTMGSGTAGIEDGADGENWFTQSGRAFVFPEKFVSDNMILYDAAGSFVYSAKIESDAIIIPADLETGIYFLTVKSGNTCYSTRVVLN